MLQDGNVRTTTPNYISKVTRGFTTLRPQAYNLPLGAAVQDIRSPAKSAADTRRIVFSGFHKCCYPFQKFDSEPERAFANLLDSVSEREVLRWMKPAPRQFEIEYEPGRRYEPDFVVETIDRKYVVEIKRADELASPTVMKKARAAQRYAADATLHAGENGGTGWAYVLLPHDSITANATLSGLLARSSSVLV
jgi:type III restriction enzyme